MPETEIGGTNSVAYDFAECRLSAAPSARASKLPAMKLSAIVPANWMLSRHSKSGLWDHWVTRVQALRHRHRGYSDQTERDGERDGPPRAAAAQPKICKAEPGRHYHGNKPQISNVEIERIDNHVMKNDKEHKRHDEIS